MAARRASVSARGPKPKKGLGQHFLVNRTKLWRIVQHAGITGDDEVVEIGAGYGNLTRALARRAGMVYAIEFDRDMAGILDSQVRLDNVRIIHENALFFDFASLARPGRKLKVVANLPYNISTQLIFRLIETPEIFSMLLLMVQREVGLRLVAEPGCRDYGLLAVFTQMLADTKIVMELGPGDFRPRPRVHSTLVRIRPLEGPREKLADEAFFRKVVRAAFSKRRKTLKNSLLKSDLGLDSDQVFALLSDCGIDPVRRAETLTLAEFANLANRLLAKRGGKK